MPEFPKPRFAYDVDVTAEKRRLTRHMRKRGVPVKATTQLLIGTWNIANLGAQDRRNEDRALLAHILKRFDLAAIQECRENIGDLYNIAHLMGRSYRVVMSDVAGNDERLVYLYDSRKVTLLDEVGEIAIPPSQLKHIKLKDVAQKFTAFDRNPYLASFDVKDMPLSVQLVNVHLYFGSDSKAHIGRRALETAAVARWADLRSRSRFAGARELIALGDFNMPKPSTAGGRIVYDALTRRGLVTPPHSTEVASAIASDNMYDQVAILPSGSKSWVKDVGVFDFDGVVFPDLWQARGEKDFKAYLRYYLSDHRPLWVTLEGG